MSAYPPMGGYNAPIARDNGTGTAALVFGILGVLGCCPIVFSVVAIIMGRSGMRKADAGLADNRGVAQAGYVLGIIGLVLAVIGAIIWGILVATGTATWNFNWSTG